MSGPWLRRLVLVLLATAGTLAALEGVLRLTGIGAPTGVYRAGGVFRHPWTEPDTELLTRLKPGIDFLGYYRTNAHGWRGPDIDDAPAPDTVRIVAVGDSTTFGIGVGADATWPQRLQDMLTALFGDEQGFEVINAGVPGYSTWQNRVQVERDLPALRPDLMAVLPVGHNDATGTSHRSDAEAAAFNRSLTGRLAQLHLARALHLFGWGVDGTPGAGAPIAPGTPGARRRVDERELIENLEAIVAATRSRDISLLFIAPPQTRPPHRGPNIYLATAASVGRVAEAAGVPLADPRPIFELHEDTERLFVDNVHPGATGQAAIALSVVEALARSDLVALDPARQAWVEAWLSARKGAQATPVLPAPRRPPPAFVPLQSAYARADIDERIQAGDRELPAAVLRFDPLYGTERGAYQATALRLRADTLEARGYRDEAPLLRETAREVEAFVNPPDLLGRYLTGLETVAPELPVSERLRRARAWTVFDRMLEGPDEPADRRLVQARERIAALQPVEAEALLTAVLRLDPDCIPALELLGLLAIRTGRLDEGRRLLERIVERAPDSPLGHVQLGRLAWEAGRWEAAESELRAALALHPAQPQARYLLGRVLMEREEWDEAEQHLRAALVFERVLFSDIPQRLGEIEERRGTASRLETSPGDGQK